MYGEYRPDESFCDECGVPFLPCDCTVAEMRRGAIAPAVLKLPPERLHAEGVTADGLMCFVDSLIEERRSFIQAVRESVPDVRGAVVERGKNLGEVLPPAPRLRTIAEIDELLRTPGSVLKSEEMVTAFMDLVYVFVTEVADLASDPIVRHTQLNTLIPQARNIQRLVGDSARWAVDPKKIPAMTHKAAELLDALSDPNYFDNIEDASK